MHTFSGQLAYPARGYTHYRHTPPSHSGRWGAELIYLPPNHGRRLFTPLFLLKATSTGRRSDHYWSRHEVVLVTIAYQYWSTQRPVLVHFILPQLRANRIIIRMFASP
nr:MAG TPA: hypothetical protein [Caudoviricetes sp.]